MKLEMLTGDTSNDNIITISLELDDNNNIKLKYQTKEAIIERSEWDKLIKQIGKRELTIWKEFINEPPIGKKEISDIIKLIHTTAEYQLFLALFDVSKQVEFPRLLDDNLLNGVETNSITPENPLTVKLYNFIHERINNKIISDNKTLFILPLVSGIDIASPSLDTLIKLNQLGKITFIHNGETVIVFYYRPYFSPFALKRRLKLEEIQILNTIGKLKELAK